MNITYTRDNGQKALKLNSVNIIEMSNGEMQGLRAFVDNPEGNTAAEARFRRLIEEHEKGLPNPSDEEDFGNYIEEGVYEDCSGYQLFLTHS